MGVKRRQQREGKKIRNGEGVREKCFISSYGLSHQTAQTYKKKHISAAYLPLPSPPTNKDEQLEDRKWSVDSDALCFHYGAPSWEPGELNDGDMDYPARTQCRV